MHGAVRLVAVLSLAALVSSCVADVDLRGGAVPGSGSRAQELSRKSVTIGIQGEPADLGGFAGQRTAGGTGNVLHIMHESLVVQNERGELRPQLAAQLPSVEDGTLRIKADGTMDVTWRLRPNAKWHDGEPFRSADMLFTFDTRKDPTSSRLTRGRPDLMQSASAPDPLTFVVHWSQPFAWATEATALDDPLPEHLLGEDYRARGIQELANSPYFSTEFMGIGPYRLVRWEQGSHMEFGRFDDYHQGRPPFDTVIVRFLGDANTMVAMILAGAVDVLLPDGVTTDGAHGVRQQWEGTGNQVRFDLKESLVHIDIQHRPEVARPASGMTNRTVRQALSHAIDRQTIVEVLSYGLAPVADSWIPPGHVFRSELERSIPEYAYGPARAHELLAQAGWVSGRDGRLIHQQTGERFDTELWAGTPADEKTLNVIADAWKALGVGVHSVIVPPARATDREYAVSFTGGRITGPSAINLYTGRLDSRFIRSAANRWTGTNQGGYSNPRADALMDSLSMAMSPREQIELHRALIQEVLTDVAVIPLYWEVLPVLALKGVKTNKMVGVAATWNFFGWDRE